MDLIIKRKLSNNSVGEIVDFLLKDRDIKNKENFLNPPQVIDIKFSSLFSNTEFEKLRNKLNEILANDEMIVVYTDYDADGITGGAIMWEALHLLGFKVMPYVPDRKTEGYGFSILGIDRVREKYNPKLIISVDHGISAEDKIAYAKTLGIDVVVTDHHLKSDKEIKSAFAVFHTEKISGAGVAYFVAREIYKNFNEKLHPHFNKDYLALASIGTIADLVPLLGEARSLAKYGMEAFLDIKRVGIKELLKVANIENRKLNTFDIGFIIAPRINAIGRLEHAIDALRLLCTNSLDNASNLSMKINEKNVERQDLVEVAVKEALLLSEKKISKNPKLKILCLVSDHWNEGIIGLIASKMLEKYYLPTIIMTISDGHAKGSARSIYGFDITGFLREHKKYLTDVGGHKAAAGFSIDKNNLDKFILALEKSADKKIKKKDLVKKIEIDFEIPISLISKELILEIEKFYPFGIGNPQPVFMTIGELTKIQVMGKSGQHLRIMMKDNSSNKNLELVFFNEGKRMQTLKIGQNLKVTYNLEINRWNGTEKIQGKGKLILDQ
jgi:single-stranded-DNA-specific exonuclease